MMKQRLTPILAAGWLAAVAPAIAAPAGCEAKLDALDARIAEARGAHAEDRVARLRAVRARVQHFCARGYSDASGAPAPAARSAESPPDSASRPAARQPA
ncbi:hypothetical protein C6Q14_13825 [Burkholderia ambifaria]|uniref:hypothetical protein n=1 Tax=Burkholderia ambifaria TaxID=152480 RepID=UPI000CFFEA94|nr:hypothetical protein [Burkholderia ambifaria]PRG05199.1 hypothetical protein C6Q14_13825 [Burkholderia ambifaria]